MGRRERGRGAEAAQMAAVHPGAPALLGKRARNEEAWRPGAGIPFSHDGTPEAVSLRAKMMRTSLLYSELQTQVSLALMRRRERDAREIRLSAEIAKSNPLQLPGEAPAHNKTAVDDASERVVASPEQNTAELDVKGKPRLEAERSLPLPLTQTVLNEAFADLDAGTRASIETCMKCWRENKLPAADVLDTVKSFAGASPALKKAFALEEAVEGEVASTEEMREILLSSC